MHAYARMKTVNAKGMNQGVVKYRYFSTREGPNMLAHIFAYFGPFDPRSHKVANLALLYLM